MDRETHIISYFSLATDLAGEMRDWPEFIAGAGYSVELRSSDPKEEVTVKLINDGEERYVAVGGKGTGVLYDRVLGRVIYALAKHSDDLMVHRWA
jgi:hypothetical protein